MNLKDYPFEVRPLPEEEGGGYLITFPDLPGCIADGETPQAAIKNGLDAAKSWLVTAREFNDPIPKPGESSSGKFVTRVPKSLHARLIARAKQEGVSMNALVTTYLAEALGKREARRRVGTRSARAKMKPVKQ
ncbi:MAG: type II toxin-antitoxin system HicB family antitoxin [candidate division KSB1 bacterium]|nr:type II toxin-antitoxin system HicB family antitoxin [candidate division KSB1 bacterium]MDZ7365779.1 type II toxin-antitoxin system HicB family antitoxin [candidate division KSB1 bacterium]MDZ7403742.1 type II toxin-antitoxin system HicB family antitoxin [candidate division KSB1 bacterium]